MVKFRDYMVKVLGGMATGLFSSLLIGLIIIQIGKLTGADILIVFGEFAQYMMGPAIGAGVALSLGAPNLVVLSAISLGAIGAGTLSFVDGAWVVAIGEPVGAFLTALIGAELGKLVYGKTSVDIVVVPFVSIVSGGLFGYLVSPFIISITSGLGDLINRVTLLRPLPMGIFLSVIMGMILTLPISSAALSISLGLNGIAAGACAVGCACNMIGFAVGSFKENGFGGLISQGLGTSMLQIPNIVKNPRIWLPSIITSAILGGLSTTVFPIEANALGAGMGTSGLVGVFSAIDTMGTDSGSIISIISMMIVLPGIISHFITEYFRKKKWIKKGDMKL